VSFPPQSCLWPILLLLLLILILSLLLHDSVLGHKAVDSARKYTKSWTVIFVSKWDREAWTGFIWLRMGTGGGILWNDSEHWGAKIACSFLRS
jgi:hypothetical protein